MFVHRTHRVVTRYNYCADKLIRTERSCRMTNGIRCSLKTFKGIRIRFGNVRRDLESFEMQTSCSFNAVKKPKVFDLKISKSGAKTQVRGIIQYSTADRKHLLSTSYLGSVRQDKCTHPSDCRYYSTCFKPQM